MYVMFFIKINELNFGLFFPVVAKHFMVSH